ncbi:pathogen-associated molecular patterns-induced protein A70 [Elaeis guineensis]|uniref:Pathogen-associated molecular patterns-induced protein A70 n=1 Tax=Elaeis guineensis var. tenera TaxID=51953 RepID=A0A6I9QAA6_ELAGV|nr:pathogen-associated molecular patterns-induced protein A70 [Elaeis guineensis]
MRLATCPPIIAPHIINEPPVFSSSSTQPANISSSVLRFEAMMMEESWPSMWSSVRDWLSPTVLFVLLNLVIGTIALTSKTLRSHRHRDDDDHLRPISRGPSAVLERLRSIGLYRFRSGDFTLDAAATLSPPSPKSETTEAPDAFTGGKQQQDHFSRCQSDSQEKPGEEKEKKLAGRMKKSASENSAFAHFEEAEIVRRPAAARSRVRAALVVEEEEEEVDARADAFINRFKQQLQLQRLDSILRYKEMLNRGK